MKQTKQEKPSLLKKNCKFAHSCHLFTKTSTTCTKKGGNYCGQYREMNNKLIVRTNVKQPKQQNNKDKVTFFVNPTLYEPISVESDDE